MAEGWSKRRLINTAAFVVGFAGLSEWLLGDGTFRAVDVAAWALVLVIMLVALVMVSRMTSLWAESLTIGVSLATLGALGELFRGDGFDWLYVTLGLAGGTVGWFVLFGLGDLVDRGARRRRGH
jgi:hypothetical protein